MCWARIFWSGLTLLTAVTHTYTELLIRHTLVGVGEATFVTIAPTFVADLFAEEQAWTHSGGFLSGDSGRDQLRDICSAAIWRRITAGAFPFYIAAAPGFLLALAVLFSERAGARAIRFTEGDSERGTILGLAA